MARYFLYGYTLETDHPLVSHLEPSASAPDLTFTCGRDSEPGAGALEVVYESPLQNADGDPMFALLRAETGFRLLYPGTASFDIRHDRIHCRLLNPADDYWVEIGLLGPVLSFWLELRGLVALHASAVVHRGRALGFMAASKSGKTSLAASFVQAGASLLTDDILPIRVPDQGAPLALAGFPQFRMWPDQAVEFGILSEDYPLAHPDFAKVRMPASAVGRFHAGTAPLAALILPERFSPSEGSDAQEVEVTWTRLAGPELVLILLQSSFAASVLERLPDMQVTRLDRISRIAERVPAFRLRYPAGYDRLPSVRDEIRRWSIAL